MKRLLSTCALALVLGTGAHASQESKTWDASNEARQFVHDTIVIGMLATGLSYSRLVENVRLSAAADRLREPGPKLVDIAFAAGYSDQANLTRAFRRWAGVPPASSAGRRSRARSSRPRSEGELADRRQ